MLAETLSLRLALPLVRLRHQFRSLLDLRVLVLAEMSQSLPGPEQQLAVRSVSQQALAEQRLEVL